ncbi:MAG: SRPBCC family protein [Bacteroidetes bacterium]|nr:SRPBCC family protein [Bacteroidota bacterium]
MIIEGKPATINQDIQSVYTFLTDFNNFQPLMPDQITNWKSDKESCSFTIQGMADISLVFSEKIPNELIKLVPQGKVPFSFSLILKLSEIESNTIVKVDVDAKLNPMMAMMAKRPLENLVNVMAGNINDAIGR